MKILILLILTYFSFLNAIWAFEELNLGDLEEIGTEHILDYSMTGGEKLESWSESTQEKKIEKKSIEPSQLVFRGQSHSLIFWENIDVDKFLSLESWKLDLEVKDKNKNWEELYRTNKQTEMVGRILSCRGECFLFRGLTKTKVEYLSQVFEGDELETGPNSVIWVFVNDGSIVRVSSESSVSFLELNFAKNRSFVRARLNKGHLFWNTKESEELPIDLGPETDAHNLPLRILEANQQFFEREIFKKQKDFDQLGEVLFLNENAITNQFAKINEMRSEFGKKIVSNSTVMIVMLNGTINFSDSAMDVLYAPGAKSYFKNRQKKSSEIILRGFGALERVVIDSDQWHEINSDGREYSEVLEPMSDLNILELLTKRIKSLELARQLWIEKYTAQLVVAFEDKNKLMTNFGYKLWDEIDLKKRIDFLIDDTKRIETSNIKSMQNLIDKMKNEKIEETIHAFHKHYDSSLSKYLLGLKKRYHVENIQVRQMTQLQYYVWTLKNGKL